MSILLEKMNSELQLLVQIPSPLLIFLKKKCTRELEEDTTGMGSSWEMLLITEDLGHSLNLIKLPIKRTSKECHGSTTSRHNCLVFSCHLGLLLP